jgi:hypothetical protein
MMSVVEPIARIMPVHNWWTGRDYRLVFIACRCCGTRASLKAGAWIHKISQRTECGELPYGGLFPTPIRDREYDGGT